MTSVFVGGFNHDYLTLLNTDGETTLKYKPTGTSNSILANRISWFYDFKAPSLTVDTACSSSMVAFHLACQSLRNRECDMVCFRLKQFNYPELTVNKSVVSGVNVLLTTSDMYGMSHHGFLSADGKCFSFDHRANGYSRGEGVGTIIIKSLSAALRDGDTIRAIVRGTGINQDGRTPGITLPSSVAQETLTRSVYANAGLDLQDTMLVESHGTGTAAGDPVEARAIASAFSSRSKEIPLYIGAIKSNIGHLEGASGVAGIIKSIMVLESAIIPPNVNFEKSNPKIIINKWNIQFPLTPTPWPRLGVRRVSINSTGFGGTNAHCILDDAFHYLKVHGLNGNHNHSRIKIADDQIELPIAVEIGPDQGIGPASAHRFDREGGKQLGLKLNRHVSTGACTPNRASLSS